MLDVRETLRDAHGRQVLLRGVNLGGTSKSPAGVGSYQKQKEGECTFVGRPVPLDEADTHLARLRQWGFTALRYVFTWEALEHDGPYVHGLMQRRIRPGVHCVYRRGAQARQSTRILCRDGSAPGLGT